MKIILWIGTHPEIRSMALSKAKSKKAVQWIWFNQHIFGACIKRHWPWQNAENKYDYVQIKIYLSFSLFQLAAGINKASRYYGSGALLSALNAASSLYLNTTGNQDFATGALTFWQNHSRRGTAADYSPFCSSAKTNFIMRSTFLFLKFSLFV